MKWAVFLDRDGVLNRAIIRAGKPYPPTTIDEFEILPGVTESLNRLREAGFLLIVVTNQPDVARGKQTVEAVELLNLQLSSRLPLDDLRICYHDDDVRCTCRKPQPGLLLEAAQDWRIDLSRSYMVGDRWRDIDAGKGAGCTTVFIDYGYTERRPQQPDAIVGSLVEATDYILSRHRNGT